MRKRRSKIVSSFYTENLVEKELVDKFTLWMLRSLIKLNTISELVDKDGYINEKTLGYFLGLESFTEDEEKKENLVLFLENKLITLENENTLSPHKTLKHNIENISEIAQLDDNEIKVLEFSILLSQYDILNDCMNLLGRNLNSGQTKRVLAIILDIPLKEINKIFSSKSRLVKSSLLTLDAKYSGSLEGNLEFIADSFAENMLSCNQDMESILKEVVYKCDDAVLCINDFHHINNNLEVLIPYLKNSMITKQKGVNVLLYGVPGTGKTELAKVISSELNAPLYEISYCDENDEGIEGVKRLRALKFAQSLLSNKNKLIMFDEVEDIFDSNDFFSKTQKNKAWINRTLEKNDVPTIWITNDVNSIDNAIVRRFDLSLEVPIPAKSKRKEIINKYSQSMISEDTISTLSKNENIAPAIVNRALKVVSSIDLEDKDKAFEMIIQNTLKAQGHDFFQEDNLNILPKTYNPAFINSNLDLNSLALGIKKNPNARICLYGPAGTGKSAYGKYIAEFLDKPLILKKASELMSMWVGGSEKNIANAFKEAKEEDGVLVFDEVDSFLSNRENASKSWEVTQVNEMLVQMENFNGIFIATTNLIENLDKASLRRFDLKLEFDFLKPIQAFELFVSECHNLNIKDYLEVKKQVRSLSSLTPGDFAAVVRQNRFMPIKDAIDFFNRLEEEIKVKQFNDEKNMGFI